VDNLLIHPDTKLNYNNLLLKNFLTLITFLFNIQKQKLLTNERRSKMKIVNFALRHGHQVDHQGTKPQVPKEQGELFPITEIQPMALFEYWLTPDYGAYPKKEDQ